LNNDTIVNYALSLIDSCWNTYASTPTRIGPETFAFVSSGSDDGYPTDPTDQAFYSEHGFYAKARYYLMRPEVLESNFYAWRVTGDTKYLDRAVDAIQSFRMYLAVGEGYAGLEDVLDVHSDKIDDTESFWFAEVLKYLYLTFDDPKHISLDEYVFNTEAHPLKAPPASDSTLPYGTGRLREPTKPFKTNSGELPQVSPQFSIANLANLLSGA